MDKHGGCSLEEMAKGLTVGNLEPFESFETPRVQMDFTIVDQYGNKSRICKDVELFENIDGDGLEVYCEAFRLLLVQAGYSFLENTEINFEKIEE